MTTVLSKGLTLSLLFSGSVHLGLMILLLWNSSVGHQELVSVEWVEVPSSKGNQEKELKTVAIKVPVKKNSSSQGEEVVDSKEIPSTESHSEMEQEQGLDHEQGGHESIQVARTAEELYKARLARELNAKKFYPSLARKLKHQGRVIVQFNVNRDGQVLEAKVIQNSPFSTLNQSAKELVEGLKALAPFPEEIKKTTWLFRVPVDYQM